MMLMMDDDDAVIS